MPASPSHAVVSQFDATQCHPEFGYLAPTMRFRRKVSLTLKAAAFGALAGAAAMFALATDREEKAAVMLATPVVAAPARAAAVTPTRAPAVDIFAPVRFVPEAFALPAAASSGPRIRNVAGSKAGAPLDLAAIAAAPPSGAEVRAKTAAQPKKKVSQPERTARTAPPEPEPRTAFAGPFGRLAGHMPGPIRSIFGFGW